MNLSLQSKLVKVRNELHAQKVGSELAYSTMLMPENAPKQTMTGTIDISTPDAVMARIKATFTRTDGKDGAPFVDFAVDQTCSTYEDWIRSIGGTVIGRDVFCSMDFSFDEYIAEITNDSVVFNIDITQNILSSQMSPAYFSVTVTAISSTRGMLVLERVK